MLSLLKILKMNMKKQKNSLLKPLGKTLKTLMIILIMPIYYKAGEYYKKTILLDPNSANKFGVYARF